MKSEFQCLMDFEHHFPDVRKMVPAQQSKSSVGINAGVRKSKERIAENIVELMEV